jgi:hypothetical protein
MKPKSFIIGGASLLLLIILAIGCVNSTTTRSSAPTSVSIPSHAGSPIISMDISHLMGGEFSYLVIYEDGYVIRREETNMRLPLPGEEDLPARSWYSGQLKEDEITSLIDLFRHSGFMDMNQMYVFAGKPTDNGATSYGDNFVTISINYGDLQKSVNASAYLAYADMPYPLNEIYDSLWGIALETSFVLSEKVPN